MKEKAYLLVSNIKTRKTVSSLPPLCHVFLLPPYLFSTPLSHALLLGCWPSRSASTGSLALWLLIEFSQGDALLRSEGRRRIRLFSCTPPPWTVTGWPYLLRHDFWESSTTRVPFLSSGKNSRPLSFQLPNVTCPDKTALSFVALLKPWLHLCKISFC